MAVSAELLAKAASIIADYREGEIARPDSAHVARWLEQFDENGKEPLISSLNHVFSKTYISKKAAESFLEGLITNPKLTGGDPKGFWSSVKFLDIQSGGKSQHEFLELLAIPMKAKTGLTPSECGKTPACFVYLDDGLYSGNTILKSLSKWVADAPDKAIVHVIVMALHTGGQYYARERLDAAAKKANKSVQFNWWRIVELEDRRAFTYSSDVLRPTKLPADATVQEYVGAMKHKPVLRTVGSLGKLGLFSDEAAREVLEQQFLLKGALIRTIAPRLPIQARPLGSSALETLGFGSTIVTFRNCPNNAPLAFWAGNPWYPLFPRKTN